MSTEKIDVRIEVFDDHVLMVLPRRMDDIMIPWQDAWTLGETLEMAANDVPTRPRIVNPAEIQLESEQIALNTHRNRYVVLLVRHTDRIKLSPGAAVIVARAIRMKAQDLDY